jgi:hypothetical protein
MRPPPFDPLPIDLRSGRYQAVRDGLIVSGLLATAFMFLVVVPLGRSLGYDAYSYWSVDLDDLYARTLSNNFTLGAFRYAPPVAFLFAPLGLLPWWLYLWLWIAAMLATIAWLGGRWALALVALPPVALELYHGNVHLLMAAAVAVGFRHPWAWSFVILTKITPGIGLLWFVVRREWRNVVLALAATAVASIASAVVAPHYWPEFAASILSNINEPQPYSVPPALPFRLPVAAVLVVWGARTDRPWTVPMAAALALPILWVHGLTVALAAVPFLRRGDRAAMRPDWLDAARLRDYTVLLAVFLGTALVLALVFAGPLSQLLDEASRSLDPYGRRP